MKSQWVLRGIVIAGSYAVVVASAYRHSVGYCAIRTAILMCHVFTAGRDSRDVV